MLFFFIFPEKNLFYKRTHFIDFINNFKFGNPPKLFIFIQ